MSRIKIVFVVFAILFLGLSSFTENPSRSESFAWFEYVYGDKLSPYSYYMLDWPPACNDDALLCAIYAEKNIWTLHLTYSSLEKLAEASINFLYLYEGTYGVVLLKD